MVDIETPEAKQPCTGCMYVVFVVFIVAAFFAGAWMDSVVTRLASKNVATVAITPMQSQDMHPKTDDVSISQTNASGTQMMEPTPSVAPPPAYIPPPPTMIKTPPKNTQLCTVALQCGGKDRNGDGIGDDVMVKDAMCKESPTGTTCKYGCFAGTCKPQPGGTAQITVTPARVHAGETVTVSWTTSGMIEGSCTVKNLSPKIDDNWKGDQGTKTSSPITERTPYLLSCAEPSGAPYSQSATVELIP